MIVRKSENIKTTTKKKNVNQTCLETIKYDLRVYKLSLKSLEWQIKIHVVNNIYLENKTLIVMIIDLLII